MSIESSNACIWARSSLILSERDEALQEELQLASSTKDVRGHACIESNSLFRQCSCKLFAYYRHGQVSTSSQAAHNNGGVAIAETSTWLFPFVRQKQVECESGVIVKKKIWLSKMEIKNSRQKGVLWDQWMFLHRPRKSDVPLSSNGGKLVFQCRSHHMAQATSRNVDVSCRV